MPLTLAASWVEAGDGRYWWGRAVVSDALVHVAAGDEVEVDVTVAPSRVAHCEATLRFSAVGIAPAAGGPSRGPLQWECAVSGGGDGIAQTPELRVALARPLPLLEPVAVPDNSALRRVLSLDALADVPEGALRCSPF